MFERPNSGSGPRPDGDGDIAPANAIGTDERRMHVRAYNYWVSLLGGRSFPALDDIDLSASGDFAEHSVLLDFRGGNDQPLVPYLGGLLRQECGTDGPIDSVADVPARSLLSRLTDHYLQIIANRSPIGFEAEFVGTRGTTMMYRGILMPFSSDGEAIDYVYGVINWKEVLDQVGTTELRLELEQALTRDAPVTNARWADGPSTLAVPEVAGEEPAEGLADRLAAAREQADRARSADGRSREALYAAIGRAHDFALAAEADREDYAEMLDDAGLTASVRTPMTPVAKLVFGVDHDKTRLAEIAAALTHARAHGVAEGGVAAWIAGHDGGLKGVVAAARLAKKEAERGGKTDAPDRLDPVRERLRETAPSRVITLPGEEEFVLIVARRVDDGHVGLLGPITDPKVVDRALATLKG